MVGRPAHAHLDLGLSRSRNIIVQCQSTSYDKFVIINIAKVKEKGNVVVLSKFYLVTLVTSRCLNFQRHT